MKYTLAASFILFLQEDVIVLETKPSSGLHVLLKNGETIFCFCSSVDDNSASVCTGTSLEPLLTIL